MENGQKVFGSFFFLLVSDKLKCRNMWDSAQQLLNPLNLVSDEICVQELYEKPMVEPRTERVKFTAMNSEFDFIYLFFFISLENFNNP